MNPVIELSPEKKRLMATQGHILALGGPGSGKTTVALLKAGHEISSNRLKNGQRVLFLSFARATIARVAEHARKHIADLERQSLEINTYHGFSWNLIKSHGYLLNPHVPIRLLPPPEGSSRLAEIPKAERPAEQHRIFAQEGLLHFDLFAIVTAALLNKSKRLCRIISDAYPIIILDEFQDTNTDEWQMIQALGYGSRLIALADAEQRIYEFRGADPKRIGEFITKYSPDQFDFGLENHRSDGTDIISFGNDLLTGVNKRKRYSDVEIVRYPPRRGDGVLVELKSQVLKARQRVHAQKGWSIAVLVPSKRMMIEVSDFLGSEQNFLKGRSLPPLSHDVLIEASGPALAADMIAALLEGKSSPEETSRQVIIDLCAYLRGHKGSDSPTQKEWEVIRVLESYLQVGTTTKQKKVLQESIRIGRDRQNLKYTGDPGEDWLSVRKLFADSTVDLIQAVAQDAKYLRLLHKGATLRARLGELWRTNHSYCGAAAAVKDALLQEHFAAATKVWTGINVMTIHKSKGKEFDEVIIFEGIHQGKFLYAKSNESERAQARLALRVAVTRAMKRATILTPQQEPCPFL